MNNWSQRVMFNGCTLFHVFHKWSTTGGLCWDLSCSMSLSMTDVTEGMFIKFAANTKLGETDNRPAGRTAVHKDLEIPEEWARGKLKKFIKDNSKMLPLCWKLWCKDTS